MAIVVLDVGKSLTKLSLWTRDGQLLERRVHYNVRGRSDPYLLLDAAGAEEWIVGVLRDFAAATRVEAIIPIGHGAAFAVIRDGKLACEPMDYELLVAPDARAEYEPGRDEFRVTGSPSLPAGLNLGMQLHLLERYLPGVLGDDALILTWPQYWAWRMCGVPATEITSLGCHTDLWCPQENVPSALARTRGWARHFAPLRSAGEMLGTITPAWSARTGLAPSVQVYCGLHDSNASLLSARSFPEISQGESTVLSTGTWFVAMRNQATDATLDIATLPEHRDCLVNVDANGRPVPSARFMGGREIELLLGADARIDTPHDQVDLVAVVPQVLHEGAMILPAFVKNCGPFPRNQGRWIDAPDRSNMRRAAICLYAALVVESSLELIGARRRILIEGRFAHAELFIRALATLRPDIEFYACKTDTDASFGALCVINPDLAPTIGLTRVALLDVGLASYRQRWLSQIEHVEVTA